MMVSDPVAHAVGLAPVRVANGVISITKFMEQTKSVIEHAKH